MSEPVDAILALVDAAPTDSTAAVRLAREGAEAAEVLAAEVRRLRAIESKVRDLAAAFEVSGSSWHKGTIAAAVRNTLEPR